MKASWRSSPIFLKDFTQFVEIMSQKMNLIQQEPPEQPPEEA